MMCAAAAAGAGGVLPSSSPAAGLGVGVISGVGTDFPCIGPGMGSGPAPGAQSDCRSRYQLLLSGRALAERYRRIYTTEANKCDTWFGSVRLVFWGNCVSSYVKSYVVI